MFKHHRFDHQVHTIRRDVPKPAPKPISAAEQKLKDAHQGVTSQETDPAVVAKKGFDKQTWVENRMQFDAKGEKPTTQAQLEAEFEKFDTDQDGVMNETEFLGLMRDRAAEGGNMNIGDWTDGTAEKGDLTTNEVAALNAGVKPKSAETLQQQQDLNKWLASDAGKQYLQANPQVAQKIGGNPPKLAEDGKEGPKTRAAQQAMAQANRPKPAEQQQQPVTDQQQQPVTNQQQQPVTDPQQQQVLQQQVEAQKAFSDAQQEKDPTKRMIGMAKALEKMDPANAAANQGVFKQQLDALKQDPMAFHNTIAAMANAKVDLGKVLNYEQRADVMKTLVDRGTQPTTLAYVAHSLLKEDVANKRPLGDWKQGLGENATEQLVKVADPLALQALTAEDRALLRKNVQGTFWRDDDGDYATTKLDFNDPNVNAALKQPGA